MRGPLQARVDAGEVDVGRVEADDVAALVRHGGLLDRGTTTGGRATGSSTGSTRARGGTNVLPSLDACRTSVSCPSLYTTPPSVFRDNLPVLAEAGLPTAKAARERRAMTENCILKVWVGVS